MDVTSLLNTASTNKAKVAKEAEPLAHTPVRNRTPWDAGGYSLPINSASQNEVFSTSENNHSLEESKDPTLDSSDIANSNHKPSDSRSSISSFSSTSTSYHSRLSSVSTVSSFYPLSVITDIGDFPKTSATHTPDKGSELQSSDISPPGIAIEDYPDPSGKMAYLAEGSSDVREGVIFTDHSQHSMEDFHKTITPSPTDSLNALATVAEHQLHDRQDMSGYHQQDEHQFRGQGISSTQDHGGMDSTLDANNMDEFGGGDRIHRHLTRSASPSDAILIKRNGPTSMSSSATTPTSSSGMNHPYGRPAEFLEANSVAGLKNPALQQRMTHKRAFSAPDFAALGVTNPYLNRKSISLGPTAELTPSPSQYKAQDDMSGGVTQTVPPTPPQESVEILDKPIVCMYIPDCDTGSQPRKAISHIFGRNKMCTRLIPNFVWVHFCRKHYQRSRYRNSKEYAKLQCDLVKKQIERLHIWSEENSRKGEGAIVKDWGIAMRKREQKRLDEMSGKKDLQGYGPDAEGESDEGENHAAPGRAVPVTAVPSWLVSLCGNGYSTEKIAEIFERLHGEILNDQIPVFPDIEILPNIVIDSEEPKSPKGYTKRRPIATAHKRSVSLGISMRTDQFTPPRRMSQPLEWNSNGMFMDAHQTVQKRKRDGGYEDDYSDRSGSQHSRYRGMNGMGMDNTRPRMTLAHRPVFSDIHEHEDLDQRNYQTYGQQHMYPDPQMFDSYGRPTAPLPAPTPQRHQALCTAAQLDSRVASPAQPQYSPYPQSRPRNMHQRTQSDMTMFQQQPQQQPQPYGSPGRSALTSVYYAPTVRTNSSMNGMINPQQAQMRNTPHEPQPRDHFSSPNMYYIGPPAVQATHQHTHTRHQSTPTIPRQYQSPTMGQQQQFGFNPRLSGGGMGVQQGVGLGTHRSVEEVNQARMLYGGGGGRR